MKTTDWLLFSLLILPMLSGCVHIESTPDEERLEPYKIRSSPWSPAIINSTSSPGEIMFEIDDWGRKECRFTNHRATFKVFDRNGHQVTHEFRIEPQDGPVNRTLEIPGEAPWIVAGKGPACAAWSGVGLSNVTDGFEAMFLRAGQRIKSTVDIHVPVGETTTEVTWTPSPETWWLFQSYQRDERRQGEQFGNISLIDPYGKVARYEDYAFGQGQTIWYPNFILIDGDYTIRLELDRPALTPTTWTYGIDYYELDEKVCPYGFEWDLCL